MTPFYRFCCQTDTYETFFRMVSRVFFPDDDIRTISCGRCAKYLSVPPIIMQTSYPICGRCATDEEGKGHRAHFYENAAKYMFFPCINDINGCSAQVPWEKVLGHEMNCKFRTIDCPIYRCYKTILKNELIQHFSDEHVSLIMQKNECSFSSGLTINQLYILKNHLFVIQTQCSEGNIFFRISGLDERTVKTLNVKLNIKSTTSSNSLCLNDFKIMKYGSRSATFSNTEKINIGVLRDAPPSDIMCYFSIEDKVEADNITNTGANKDKVLSELKCPICFDRMKPPIYMCSTGHSLCGTCKVKMLKCPSCTAGFDNTRNFSLEAIADLIVESCDLSENIATSASDKGLYSPPLEGELNCLVNQTPPCQWKGSYSEVFQHLTSSHASSCFDFKYPLSVYVNDLIKKVAFFQCDKKIFKLNIDSDVADPCVVRWSIVYIKDTEEIEQKYVFHLYVAEGERIFNISEVCHPISATIQNQNCTSFINIPLSLLKPFIKVDTLKFKIYITISP